MGPRRPLTGWDAVEEYLRATGPMEDLVRAHRVANDPYDGSTAVGVALIAAVTFAMGLGLGWMVWGG